jgi:glycosyltransferase involved in cell wall biosynthesis
LNECSRKVWADRSVSKSDIWLLALAQDPLVEEIRDRYPSAEVYGHIHGTACNPYECANQYATDLCEERRLPLYTKLFTNSRHGKRLVTGMYQSLRDKVVVTGFPVNKAWLSRYVVSDKDRNTIVFAQRFSTEKNFPIVIELSNKLTKAGYTVKQMVGSSREEFMATPEARHLPICEQVGLEMQYNTDKASYFLSVSGARCVVFTSLYENMSVGAVEGVMLGANLVAPRSLSFPEFLDHKVLYTPYALDEILELVEFPPSDVRHNVGWTESEAVVHTYAKEMGLTEE